jgi:hypothetical protein
MTRVRHDRGAGVSSDGLREKEAETAKRCVWENVCPNGAGTYTATPASIMTC